MMKIGNILWGIVLIGLGIVLGINALSIAYIDIFFDGWWTLFIIIPCFIGLFSDRDRIGNLIGLVVGILLLLSCNHIFDIEVVWKLLLPIVLIMLGISCIFKNGVYSKTLKEMGPVRGKEFHAVFAGQNLDFSHEVFEGGKLNSIFGGIQCDLRQATISDKSVIEANSIFGGITIIVPEDVEVKVVATPIFGGVSNKKGKVTLKNKIIYVKALCIFGGVEIRS